MPAMDSLDREILSAVYAASQLESQGSTEAEEFRMIHPEWRERLTMLESGTFLRREFDQYRVTIFALPEIGTDAWVEVERCDAILLYLSDRYTCRETRKVRVFLHQLANDMRLGYRDAAISVRFLADISHTWMMQGPSDFFDEKNASVLPGEGATNKTSVAERIDAVNRMYVEASKKATAYMTTPMFVSTEQMVRTPVSTLRPDAIILGFLQRLNSDEFLSASLGAGISIDSSLPAGPTMYTHRTRIRVYLPRLTQVIEGLSDDERLLATNQIASYLLEHHPDFREQLEAGLAALGWTLADGRLRADDQSLSEVFFPKGSQHDAYRHLRKIFNQAEKSLLIVDGYVDSNLFVTLSSIEHQELSIQVLTSQQRSKDFVLEAKRFCEQYSRPRIQVRIVRDFHDRFVFVDKKDCYHLGASIKDAGKSAFMISKMMDEVNVRRFVEQYEDSWEAAREEVV
jgi:hypothetical protein